ncbi:peptidase [Actinomadura logoneensis]|uniref:Peptidase n=1 Tax=Actinomadura logoneensis TaxID=2293572 RepID=A0A372JKS8_9ACTN|nr:peptidase [Actinomadura logoneensis]
MRRSVASIRRSGVLAGLGAALLALGSGALAAPAHAAPAGPSPDAAKPSRVIVLLKTPSARDGLVAKVRGAGGTKIVTYQAVPSFAATVSADQAVALANDPAVAAVVPDTNVPVAPPAPSQKPTAPVKGMKAQGAPSKLPPTVCPSDPRKPLLEPEALTTTRASLAHRAGIDGSGVTVAYIADGVDPNNPDFVRPNGRKVFTDYKDFSGEGPDTPSGGAEAFGDASAIGAQGRMAYDVSDYAHPSQGIPKGCTIRVLGMAPGASIVGLKAGGELLPNSAILQSIDYAISRHVDVLNESFGSNVYPDDGSRDTIRLFNDAAVRAGVTVTVSTGDAGITGTQGSPSTDPNVIAAAGSTDFQNYQQTGYGAARFAKPGRWLSDNISALSSGGVSQGGRVPDLAAPGESDWALCTPDPAKYENCVGYSGKPASIQPFGGTSQSAPLTAGAAALVIQAFRSAHHGQSPSPLLVKRLLTGTAHDLGLPAPEQGAGLLDAKAAVDAARAYKGTANVVPDITQTTLTGTPGGTVSKRIAFTNHGSAPAKVRFGTRSYATRQTGWQTVPFQAASLPTFPYATNGAPWSYKKVTFKVAKGTDVLGVSTAWQGVNATQPNGAVIGPVVRLTLVDPNGAYAANSRPQGGAISANHAYVDVRYPAAGTWTAILYSPQSGPQSYSGPVQFATSAAKAVARGTVSPSALTLKPGQTGHVTFRARTDGNRGDLAEAVWYRTSAGQAGSVPAVIRTLLPTRGGRGTFSGTITGGNGRAYAPAQTATYAFDVPKGRRDLGVTLKLARDPKVLVEAALVDPDGQLIGTGSNARDFREDGTPVTADTLQVTQADPVPGRWRLTVIVANPVSGREISQNFTGTIGFDQVKVTGSLPRGAKLPAGKAASFTLTYANRGVAPVPVQVNPRLQKYADVPLAPLGSSPTITLPITPTSSVPAYLVPPGTRALSLAARSSTPAQVELQGPAGQPDVFGDLGSAKKGDLTSIARVSEAGGRHVLARGFWFSYVQQIGPFSGPAPSGTSTLGALAKTQPWDTAVTSPAGDPYRTAVTGDFTPNGTPVVVQPGRSGKVSVTFTPSGKPGTVVDGVLYLVTSPVGAFNGGYGAIYNGGDVLAAIPYSYTVG